MDNLVHFPAQFRLVPEDPDPVVIEMRVLRQRHVAQALEHIASANLDIAVDNLTAGEDSLEGISDETIISLAHAFIHLIDAKGCRNIDRALRAELVAAIELREASDAG